MSSLEKPEGLHSKSHATEEEIERKLESLPEEIRERWEERFVQTSHKQLPHFQKDIDAFIAERDKARKASPRLFSGMRHNVEDQKMIEQTLAVVQEAERREDLFVGKGQVAEVRKSPRNPGLCFKVVHDTAKYEELNPVDKEGHFLEELEDLEVEGVRVPRLSSIIDLPNVKVIEMEYLDAISLERAFLEDHPILEKIDPSVFLNKLRSFVRVMHEKYHVYHRDLHEGNILIAKNGTPYVIDFGCAAHAIDPETAYEMPDKTGRKITRFVSDNNRLDSLEKRLQKHQKERVL